jgi:hypothetical protein
MSTTGRRKETEFVPDHIGTVVNLFTPHREDKKARISAGFSSLPTQPACSSSRSSIRLLPISLVEGCLVTLCFLAREEPIFAIAEVKR